MADTPEPTDPAPLTDGQEDVLDNELTKLLDATEVTAEFEANHKKLWEEDIPARLAEHGPAALVLVAHQNGQTTIISFLEPAGTARILFNAGVSLSTGEVKFSDDK